MTETAQQAARRLAVPMLNKGFRPQGLFTYTDATGAVIYHKARARHPGTGEKWIRPFHKNGDGYVLGEPKLPNGKPLYRLHELAASPGAPCWYVEGENCADALAGLKLLATTAGSASSDEAADFATLKGRAVTIWPDNDKAGIEHGERVAAKLRALSCNVETIDVAALALPDGGDVVDWLKAHPSATAADLAKLPRTRRLNADRAVIEADASGLVLRRLSDVQPRPIHWLWQGRIARGKVTMLAGHPGLGKSQICASIAAVVTTGGLWPVDRTRCERGTALIFSAEDDAEDTIRPRLEAAGADLTRVHVLDTVMERKQDGTIARRGFSLAHDMPRLAAKLAELQDVALVVIDPISAFLGDTDSHQNSAVRAVLAPLAEVAARHGAAVIAVSHLRKSAAGEAMHNITGSLAFVAAARAAYIVAKDQADPLRRLLLPAKNNLGDDQTGYAFSIEGATIAGDIATSRVLWAPERVTVTAEEALAPADHREERSSIEEAGDFLRAMLADGPMAARRLLAESRDAGHAEKTIRRAAKAIGVEQYKEGMQGGWFWKITPKMAKTPEDAQGETLTTFGQVGHLREPTEAETPATDPEEERL